MQYYDPKNKRLVDISQRATPEFWDKNWQDNPIDILEPNPFVLKWTRRYLLPGTTILEGGCGCGQNVYTLHNAGYACYGVDFASETIAKINHEAPELWVYKSNVKYLMFYAKSFDGYWSLGVIEHFYEGYDQIRAEMYRVLKPGGYLFLTVPTMSPLRRLKARLGMYPVFDGDYTNFYQFVLPDESVIQEFTRNGFELIHKEPKSGLNGFDMATGSLLYKLYVSRNIFARIAHRLLKTVVRRFASHMTFFVFRKQ